MAKHRVVSTRSYGLKEEIHYLYYASRSEPVFGAMNVRSAANRRRMASSMMAGASAICWALFIC